MEWWDLIIFPAKRVWIGVAARFSLRKNGFLGLRQLKQEVITCEYEDVRVMWEMLRKSETETARFPAADDRRTVKRRRRWSVSDLAPYHLCARF
ncbi:hypothetical protein KSP39_PZI000236 [Platanthera zijinensis]|uniref:Uncharacterized protein n=1 Tax=Platanthera zijinensis TaxID=2320716 RepID=A0AAP0C259_9ASPA